jgi:hypothetical protein
MGKRPPSSDERLREVYTSAVLTTDPTLTGRAWTTAVTERAYSILTTEDEIIDKLRTLDACYSDNPAGKAYYGVIVAAYIDPKIAYRGFIRFLAPNPEDRTGPWLEEEVRTAPLRGNLDAQHLYKKAVSLIGHRVLIAKNKDANAPKTRTPWVLTHLEDGGYDTTKPNWGAEWSQATTTDLNPVPSNAHIIPGGAPANGFSAPITDTVALALHGHGEPSPEASAPEPSAPHPSPAAAPEARAEEPPAEAQPADGTGQQQLSVSTGSVPVSVPPNQAFLHQDNNPAPEQAPTDYTSIEAKNAIISGAKALGLGEEEAVRAAKAAWSTALAAPASETVSAQQVEQAVAWISEQLARQASPAQP